MTDSTEHGGRRGRYLAAAITAVLAVAGAVLLVLGAQGTAGPPLPDRATAPTSSTPLAQPQASPTPKTSKGTATTPKPIDFGPVLPSSPPVALDIPAIDVHSTSIVDLGFADDGSIEVPRDPSAPGWFTPGPSPGQLGPAVIAGHVDSTEGPAVFYELGGLQRGDRVKVTRADASVATFVVDQVSVFPKANFPTHRVYGNTTSRAELRLITCGGTYDETTGYVSNVVVFAHLISPGRASAR